MKHATILSREYQFWGHFIAKNNEEKHCAKYTPPSSGGGSIGQSVRPRMRKVGCSSPGRDNTISDSSFSKSSATARSVTVRIFEDDHINGCPDSVCHSRCDTLKNLHCSMDSNLSPEGVFCLRLNARILGRT